MGRSPYRTSLRGFSVFIELGRILDHQVDGSIGILVWLPQILSTGGIPMLILTVGDSATNPATFQRVRSGPVPLCLRIALEAAETVFFCLH